MKYVKTPVDCNHSEWLWVFCNKNGDLLHPNNLRNRVFYDLLDKGKLRKIRFHDLRHTFSSLLLQQGESPVYVKDQMGHSSIQVTVDIYGHLIPGGNKAAVDRLDEPTKAARDEAETATPAQLEDPDKLAGAAWKSTILQEETGAPGRN